ncbi:hypothetical protein ACJX0J_011663, partial [Zea mays]
MQAALNNREDEAIDRPTLHLQAFFLGCKLLLFVEFIIFASIGMRNSNQLLVTNMLKCFQRIFLEIFLVSFVKIIWTYVDGLIGYIWRRLQQEAVQMGPKWQWAGVFFLKITFFSKQLTI